MATNPADIPATRWIVWGEGDPVPHAFFDEEVADPASVETVLRTDPEWEGLTSGWAVVVSATGDELEGWASMNPSVRGFGPHRPDARSTDHIKIERPRPY